MSPLFKKDSLLKNASILVSGTIIAQLIPVLMQPVLKRIFEPEDFGVFDIYLKTLGILFVIFAMKYDMGIILPKNRVKALALLVISVAFSLFFTLFFTLLVFIFEEHIIALLHIDKSYSFVLYILPFSTLFFSLYNAFNYLLIRNKQFFSSSLNKVSRRSIEGGVQLGIGLSGSIKHYGLFVGDIIGNMVYFLAAYWQSFKGFKIEPRLFRYSFLKSVAKEYRELPIYNIIPELLNTGFFAALSFLVLSKYDIREVGFMELTQRILAIPSAFIAYSIGQVVLQKTTEMINSKQRIKKEISQVIYLLTVLAVPFIIIIFFFAEPLFSFFFGERWAISGTYSKYLVFFYAIAFVVSPLSQILIALQEFKVNALWKIGRFFIILPLFFITLKNIDNYLISYSVLGIISYIAYFIIILFYANKYDKSLNK